MSGAPTPLPPTRRSRVPRRPSRPGVICPARTAASSSGLLGEELRREKGALGALVTLEVGKIAQEGLGEVQEMIDICDFAVGLSRQLYGRSIASERPGHRLTETWHPLGPVAVISAFNFPVAVWSWNAALALVCGDPVIWKPSERTPLTALACMSLARPGGAAIRWCARGPRGARDRRGRSCSAARRRPADPSRLGHRLDADGQGAGAADRGPPRPLAARARRQQRCDRRPERGHRPRRSGGALLGRRDRGSAVYDLAPAHRARVDRRRGRRAARRRVPQRADR